MAASSQFTPSQIMDAARKAEAEGKFDYALQFYRHVIEHHGAEIEAYEARDGFQRVTALQREVRARHHRAGTRTASNLPMVVRPEPRSAPHEMPAEPEFEFKERYRAGTLMAQGANWAGWMLVGTGAAIGAAGVLEMPDSLAAPAMLGLPLGIVIGLGAAAAGLALVFLSQLALAVFDNANAARHLLAIERAKAEL